jgi:hypothetical protein
MITSNQWTELLISCCIREAVSVGGRKRPQSRAEFEDKLDQYRATTMIATTMNAAISERIRSNAFERGSAVGASSGGMTKASLC